MTATAPPATLAVNPDAIPAELRERPQWVCWRWEWRGDRWTKVPLNPATGAQASTTDPATWGTFDQALARYRARNLPGVGFVFAPDDPYCGIDIDHCRDAATGALTTVAKSIVAALDAYAEASPTGTGVHVIARARLPGKGRKDSKQGIELYDSGRYFTITGHAL